MKANTGQQDERPMPEIMAGYWDQVMDILAWACLIALIGFGMYILGTSPGSELAGTVTVLVPLAIVLVVGFHFLKKIPHKFNYLVRITPENAQRQYTLALRMLRMLSLVILFEFALVMLMVFLEETKGIKPNEGLIAFVVISGFIPLVYYFWHSMKK